MDWKHECGTKIFSVIGYIIILLFYAPAAAEMSGDKNLMHEFDKKIRDKSFAIDSIKQELDRGRIKIRELDKKEGSYLEQLELLEKNIENSHAYLKNVIEKIDTLSLQIDILRDSLKAVSAALVQRQEKMTARLRTIYMSRRMPVIGLLLTSGTVTEMLHRIRYFQELNRYDKRMLRGIDSTRAIVENQKRVLEVQQLDLITVKMEKENESNSLKKEQQKRKAVLTQVREEKKAFMLMVKELERAQEELNMLVKTLEKKRKEARVELERGLQIAFEKRKGKLPWPAEGPVSRGFGKIVHPVYKTVTVSNGIDIQAQKGEKVFCVAPGKIEYVGWMRGYGKFVIVNHFGGYMTIYAHLDQVSVTLQQDVGFGQQVGFVGETGSLTGPKLHFQIRLSAETLDPCEWLEKKE